MNERVMMVKEAGDADTTSRQLEERGSVVGGAPLQGGTGFEMDSKLSAWPAPAHGAWCSAWDARPEEASICLCGYKTVTFSPSTGDSSSVPSSFECREDLFPQTIHSYF